MRRLLSVVLSIALFLCLVPLAGLSALAAEPLVLSNNFDTEKTITYYLTPQTEGGSFSCRTAPEDRDGNYGISILADTTESSPGGGDKGVMQFAVNNNKNGCPEMGFRTIGSDAAKFNATVGKFYRVTFWYKVVSLPKGGSGAFNLRNESANWSNSHGARTNIIEEFDQVGDWKQASGVIEGTASNGIHISLFMDTSVPYVGTKVYLDELTITETNKPIELPKAEAPEEHPTVVSKTATSVTLAAVDGYQYRLNTGVWHDSPVFEDLIPETSYTFTQRVAATAEYAASPASPTMIVTTPKSRTATPVVQIGFENTMGEYNETTNRSNSGFSELAEQSTAAAHSGTTSMALTYRRNGDATIVHPCGFRIFGDELATLPNNKGVAGDGYTISFWYKVQNLPCSATLYADYGSINFANYQAGERSNSLSENIAAYSVGSETLGTTAQAGEWTHFVSRTFSATSTDGFHIALVPSNLAACSGATVYIDDVVVERASIASRPGLAEFTANSIRLLEQEDMEYKMDNGAWQASPLFEGLTEGKEYSFYQRYTFADGSRGAASTPLTVAPVASTGLYSIHVTLTDADLPYIHKVKGNAATEGTVVAKDDKGEVYFSGDIDSFKGRGNASWTMAGDKKSYNIKLSKKDELIPGAGKAKSWTLVANNSDYMTTDRSGISNYVAQTLNMELEGESALTFIPVDLYIQGELRGTYILIEKPQINEFRVNIVEADMTEGSNERTVTPETSNKTEEEQALLDAGIREFRYVTDSVATNKGGFLLEIDSRYNQGGGEASWFVTRHNIQIVLNTPEFATFEQVRDIALYVQDMEDAIYSETGYNTKGKHYTEYIDLDALAKHYILDCFLAQRDIMKTSCYMYIDGNDDGFSGKMTFGPAWDYDYTFVETEKLFFYTSNDNEAGGRKLAEDLLTRADFVDAVFRLNEETFKDLAYNMAYEQMDGIIDELAPSGKLNEALWGHDSVPFTFEDMTFDYSNNFVTRESNWADLWSYENGKLMGGRAYYSSGKLTVAYNGTADTIQWYKVDDADMTKSTPIDGATEAEYTPSSTGIYYAKLTGDALGAGCGKTYAGDDPGAVMYTNAITVKGAAPAAPAAPTAAEVTENSVTLNEVAGCEYSKDGTNWQASPVFTGLLPATEYTFYQRIAETDTTFASAASAALTLTTSGEELKFTATFAGDNCVVSTYATQDTTTPLEVGAITAVARNSDTGEIDVSGDGQINFSVVAAPGYKIESVAVTEGTENFKNLKDQGDGVYRITKIKGDLTVTVTTVLVGFKATFVAEHCTVTTFATQDTTTPLEVGATTAIARDSDTGEMDLSGDGQINFLVVAAPGYKIVDVTVAEIDNFKNLKNQGDGVYRITKIKGDLTVTVTVEQDGAAVVLGDLNGDSEINSDDLTLLAQQVAKIATLEGAALTAGDVNKDGEVNSDDLTLMAQYVAKIIDTFESASDT